MAKCMWKKSLVDEHAECYHELCTSLHFYREFQHLSNSVFSLQLFWFHSYISEKKLKKTLCTKRQTKLVTCWWAQWSSWQLKSHIFPSGVSGDKNRAKKRANIGLTFIRWTQTWLQMNASVSPCLLGVLIGNCLPYQLKSWCHCCVHSWFPHPTKKSFNAHLKNNFSTSLLHICATGFLSNIWGLRLEITLVTSSGLISQTSESSLQIHKRHYMLYYRLSTNLHDVFTDSFITIFVIGK